MKPSDLRRFLLTAPDDECCRLLCERAGTWKEEERRVLKEVTATLSPATGGAL